MKSADELLIEACRHLLPDRVVRRLPAIYYALNRYRYRLFSRPYIAKETSKARARRERQGFFDRFCQGAGLDIGYGGDLIVPTARGWDVEDGDAQELPGVGPNSFDFVYSSHLLEHIQDPAKAVARWWDVVRPAGYLILYLPERDLFEKRTRLPSDFSADHKHFFLLDRDDPPDTIGVLPLIHRMLRGAEIVYGTICNEGYRDPGSGSHPEGEYSIEIVVAKQAKSPSVRLPGESALRDTSPAAPSE